MPYEADFTEEEIELAEEVMDKMAKEEKDKHSLGLSYHKALSSLNETSGGALVPPPKQKRAIRPLSFGHKQLSPPKTKGSFFSTCERDEQGHCLPGSGGGSKPSAPELTREEREQQAAKRKQRRLSHGASRQFWRSIKGKAKQAVVAAGRKVAETYILGMAVQQGMDTAKAVRKAVGWLGQKVWDAIPEVEQEQITKVVQGAQWVEHKLESFYGRTQELAEQICKERGVSRLDAKRVKRVCATVDWVARQSINIPITHAHLEAAGLPGAAAFVGAKLTYFAAVGSMAFIGASTVSNPLATWRAAKKLADKYARHTSHHHKSLDQDEVGKLVDAISKHQSDEFLALVYIGIDRKHELAGALAFAEHVWRGEGRE